jgi:hypothetical protein
MVSTGPTARIPAEAPKYADALLAREASELRQTEFARGASFSVCASHPVPPCRRTADPPTFRTAVLAGGRRDPRSAVVSLRVVEVRDDDADQPPRLVVEPA